MTSRLLAIDGACGGNKNVALSILSQNAAHCGNASRTQTRTQVAEEPTETPYEKPGFSKELEMPVKLEGGLTWILTLRTNRKSLASQSKTRRRKQVTEDLKETSYESPGFWIELKKLVELEGGLTWVQHEKPGFSNPGFWIELKKLVELEGGLTRVQHEKPGFSNPGFWKELKMLVELEGGLTRVLEDDQARLNGSET
ncbi:hypothetical protein EDB19DRAFT_1909100 [Suillus lakei]|nr:hypothetical protein EDB19DRAFT_1909100 [Suillus lakei]